MAFTPIQPAPSEVTIPGQCETSIGFDLVTEGHALPFVAMTVTGPENALCVRLAEPTLGDVIRRLTMLKEQLKALR